MTDRLKGAVEALVWSGNGVPFRQEYVRAGGTSQSAGSMATWILGACRDQARGGRGFTVVHEYVRRKRYAVTFNGGSFVECQLTGLDATVAGHVEKLLLRNPKRATCVGCGREFAYAPTERHPRRKFHSDRCRLNYHAREYMRAKRAAL